MDWNFDHQCTADSSGSSKPEYFSQHADVYKRQDISRDRSIHAIEEAMVGDQKIFLITQQDASVEEPARDDLYQIGVIAEVKQVIKMPNEIVRVLVEGLERGELASFLSQEKYLMAEVILFD